MPFAIELFFDSETDQIIRRIWHKFAQTGISAYLDQSDSRPHITLAVFDEIHLEECQTLLNHFVGATRFSPLTLSHLGVFYTEKNVVFAAPTVTADLLEMHHNFHRLFQAFIIHEWHSYQEGVWVPHCTLGVDIPREKIPEAVQASLEIPLPLQCKVGEVGLIEFRPVRQLCTYKL